MNEKNQEEKPVPPKRPKPDPDLKDPQNNHQWLKGFCLSKNCG